MTELYKYPKTFHIPMSLGITNEDKVMSIDPFRGKEVVILEKMDGENTSLYPDYIHARSLDSAHHVSRDWVKTYWGGMKHQIPDSMRVCGENMFAKHSIFYDNLESYFLGFSMWEYDRCLDWDSTVEYFNMLGIISVPVLYEGIYSTRIPLQIWNNMDHDKQEGLVIRLKRSFTMDEFRTSVGKYVRKGHVQTDKFWRTQPVIQNQLVGE